MHVEFESVDPEVERIGKGSEGVFGPKTRAPAMGDVERFGHGGVAGL
jgi:hypothetical protein